MQVRPAGRGVGRAGSRDAVRGGSKPERRSAATTLEVADVVQRGMGRGSRIDLTIASAGRRVRLVGLPAKHVLSYARIEKAAMEEGTVLPFLRYGNRVWRKLLSPAMERARFEPWLEGEEIASAIAAEIRALLEGAAQRGERAADLMAGKLVRQGDSLLVSPRTLVATVRSRLVDDVLPQATIAEAAMTHFGMRESRPRFADSGSRPRAWAFPLPLAKARGHRGLDEGISTTVAEENEAPEGDVDPVHGPRVLGAISRINKGMQAGSSGPAKYDFTTSDDGRGET